MHGIGSLSKNVLGLKFMKRTKDELEKKTVEHKHREYFTPTSAQSPTSISIPIESKETDASPVVFKISSYSQVLGYKFGRASFGGFNPTVEDNVARLKWKSFELNGDTEDVNQAVKLEIQHEQSECPPRKRQRMTTDDGIYGKQLLQSKSRIDVASDDEELLVVNKRGGWISKGLRSNPKQFLKFGRSSDHDGKAKRSRHRKSRIPLPGQKE